MARVTPDDIRLVYNTSATDDEINAFISSSNNLVNENLLGVGYSETILTEIEKYLTCHIMAHISGQITRERADSLEMTYADVFSDGLKATSYGSMVAMYDTSGILAGLAADTKKASFHAISVRYGSL